MYVIFPAEDLVELTLTRPPVYLSPTAAQQRGAEAASPKPLPRPPPASKAEKSRPVEKARAGKKVKVKKSKWDKDNEEEDSAKMATGSGEGSLRDLSHPSLNEPLRAHNAATFKLVRTVSDFTQELSKMYEQHAEELQHLVANFRKKNAELRKERPACPSSLVHTWESLLQEVEVDSQAHSDVASVLGRQVSRPLLERSFHRKVQSRKVFAHRETLELMINKAEDKLAKARQDYKNAYLAHLSSPSSSVTLTAYLDAHNHYVSTLHATNGMIEKYSHETLPQLLQELEDVYSDLCSTLSDSVLQGAEVISARAIEQSRRYETLSAQCRSVLPSNDLAHFVRSLSPLPTHPHPTHRLRLFNPPQPPNQEPPDGAQPDIFLNHENLPPSLRNELVIDRSASLDIRTKYDSLRVEEADLMAQISKLQDSLDTLCRIQQRSVESSLFNKANEIQEDISVKKLDLRTAQIHLAAVRAQKDLFATKFENNEGNTRKMSSASTGSMKSKWIKAFKILKAPSGPSNGSSNKESERKSARDGGGGINSLETAHQFQEYTYKKITPCDVCSQVLRGHTRQGLKCRLCKMNVHLDCQDKATSKCNSKSRLLRRQKSTSEIETRISATQEEEGRSMSNASGNASPSNLSISRKNLDQKIYSRQNSPKLLGVVPERATECPDASGGGGGGGPASGQVDDVYQVLKQAGEISGTGAVAGLGPGRPIPPRSPATGGDLSSLKRTNQPPSLLRGPSSLSVVAPPIASSSDKRLYHRPHYGVASPLPAAEAVRRRRLFGGIRSLSMFGARSQGRSISLPETPHSPRRHKLNLRMKSLSLDSPESTEHVQRRRTGGSSQHVEAHSSHSSSSRLQSFKENPVHEPGFRFRSVALAMRVKRPTLTNQTRSYSTPSSPVHNRRLLSARNMRMSSVELPDDNEKSLSSASTSPCPSPKPHRLLPTNLYVVLYNFKSRHADELDLKAGYKVTVIDSTDQDWWKGKCLGRVGYFPSKYVTKLQPGERPLQVIHNLQVKDGDCGLTLLRDQIVIQIGEEVDGTVMIRNGDNRQGFCPVKYLQEV
ncbi:uncharacterized protein [Bemisia tabaci]|uniref:uncharacterized protein isoform X3 n=1 Tax=Bemisia tabaci TaxID=7038 RepID=UPI003B282D7E